MKSPPGWLLALGLSGCTAVAAPDVPAPREVRSADGVPIVYEVSGAGEPTLLFVHGWAGERSSWRATMQAFGATHRVVALDLAGHGDSGAGRKDWTLAAFADDVAAVVQALDLQRVILVGHSMGGPVALLAAPRLAPRVVGVIGVESLHDAELRYPPGYLEQTAAALEADFARTMADSIRSVASSAIRPELYDWILARALRTDHAAAAALLRGLGGFELGPVLSAVHVPVRCINAAADAPGRLATDVKGNRRFADFDATLLDGVGHFPMLERPAAFQDALARWVAELERN